MKVVTHVYFCIMLFMVIKVPINRRCPLAAVSQRWFSKFNLLPDRVDLRMYEELFKNGAY